MASFSSLFLPLPAALPRMLPRPSLKYPHQEPRLHSLPAASNSSARPSARARRSDRLSGATHPLAPAKTFRRDASVSDAFLSSKRDKRLIKHSAFLSRIASSAGVIKAHPPRPRRRHASRTSTTLLQSLADALPDIENDDENSQLRNSDPDARRKIRHCSLKSRPGALKRKERIVRGEMFRFSASMARLAAHASPSDTSPTPLSNLVTSASHQDAHQGDPPSALRRDPWAALRGYISQTMEQAPAFSAKN